MKAGSGKRIIFAVTSPYGVSRSALSKATRLASAMGAELELLYRRTPSVSTARNASYNLICTES